MLRRLFGATLLLTTPWLFGCQNTTDPDETLAVDDFVEVTFSPSPAIGEAATDGKTYRVVRGNNQPDDILAYDWRTSFTMTVTLNSNTTDAGVEFPVYITSASVKVEQASGGIVNPPTGGELEHYESVITATSGNRFDAEGNNVTMTFVVWYDLPNLLKEALITVTISFSDDDGAAFSKSAKVAVAP